MSNSRLQPLARAIHWPEGSTGQRDPPARGIHLHVIYSEETQPPPAFTHRTCLKQVLLDTLQTCTAHYNPPCTPQQAGAGARAGSVAPRERKPKRWQRKRQRGTKRCHSADTAATDLLLQSEWRGCEKRSVLRERRRGEESGITVITVSVLGSGSLDPDPNAVSQPDGLQSNFAVLLTSLWSSEREKRHKRFRMTSMLLITQ